MTTKSNLKFSLITACKNSRDTIGDSLDSVIQQDYPHVECIVVDGGSSDGTLEYVLAQNGAISKGIKGPDSGIYDALNKGVGQATGDVVGFVHSDDFLVDSRVLTDLANEF